MTNIGLSVDIATRITKILNDQILKSGEIQINNSVIWDGILHKMDNSIWRGIIEMLNLLNEQHPDMLSITDLANIQDAEKLLDKFEDYYESVLDMPNRHVGAKKVAWRTLMSTREIICRCWNMDLPNNNTGKVLSNYGDLFE